MDNLAQNWSVEKFIRLLIEAWRLERRLERPNAYVWPFLFSAVAAATSMSDLVGGWIRVHLPDAVAGKYPNAGAEWVDAD
jgi:hypothetical protein